MEDAQAKALVSRIEAAWMPMPDSKLRVWIEELRDVECFPCAYHALRTLIRELHFAPAIADLLAEYHDQHRRAHLEALALTVGEWTEEDERASEEARLAALADWNERHESKAHDVEDLVEGIGA